MRRSRGTSSLSGRWDTSSSDNAGQVRQRFGILANPGLPGVYKGSACYKRTRSVLHVPGDFSMSRPRPSGYSAATISPRVIVGIALLTVLGGCADHKRTGSADSDLSRDLQLAGQIAAQPTFQDTALSSSAAPARQTAPERTPTPTRRVAHREE